MSEIIKDKESREAMSYEDMAEELKASEEHIKQARKDAAEGLLGSAPTTEVVTSLQEVQELEGYSMALEHEINSALKEAAPFESDESNASYNRLLDEYSLQDDEKSGDTSDSSSESAKPKAIEAVESEASEDYSTMDDGEKWVTAAEAWKAETEEATPGSASVETVTVGTEEKTEPANRVAEEADATNKKAVDSYDTDQYADTMAKKIAMAHGLPLDVAGLPTKKEQTPVSTPETTVTAPVVELQSELAEASQEETSTAEKGLLPNSSEVDLNNLTPAEQAAADSVSIPEEYRQPVVTEQSKDLDIGTTSSSQEEPGRFQRTLGELWDRILGKGKREKDAYKGKHRKPGWFTRRAEAKKRMPKLK